MKYDTSGTVSAWKLLLLGRWKMDDKAVERRLRCPKFWTLSLNTQTSMWTRCAMWWMALGAVADDTPTPSASIQGVVWTDLPVWGTKGSEGRMGPRALRELPW